MPTASLQHANTLGWSPFGLGGRSKCPSGSRREVIHGRKTHRCLNNGSSNVAPYMQPDDFSAYGTAFGIPQDTIAELARTAAEIRSIINRNNPADINALQECERKLRECRDNLRECRENETAMRQGYEQRFAEQAHETQRCMGTVREYDQILARNEIIIANKRDYVARLQGIINSCHSCSHVLADLDNIEIEIVG